MNTPPHPAMIEALANVQLRSLDHAIADFETGLQQSRKIAEAMLIQVCRYEEALTAMKTKRRQILKDIVGQAAST